MPFVTSFERLAREEGIDEGREERRKEGRKEGREEGLKHGIRIALALKFGEAGAQLQQEVEACEDVPTLERILDAIPAVEALRTLW
jgi:hypothetical protein